MNQSSEREGNIFCHLKELETYALLPFSWTQPLRKGLLMVTCLTIKQANEMEQVIVESASQLLLLTFCWREAIYLLYASSRENKL